MTELNYIQMGARIRKSREALFLTQEKLAEKLDVSVKFVCDIEAGAKGMSLKTLNKLSNSLLVSADYILYGDDENGECGEIIRLLQKCPCEKRRYALDIIKVYVKSCM